MFPLVVGGIALGLWWLSRHPNSSARVPERAASVPSATSLPAQVVSGPGGGVTPPTIGTVPPLAFIPFHYTNRPTGPITAPVTETIQKPNETDATISLVQGIVKYVQTAVNVAVQAGVAAGSAVASAVASYIPIVGQVIGVAMFGAEAAKKTPTVALYQSGAAVTVGPGALILGVQLAIEGAVAAQQLRHRIHDEKMQYAQAVLDVKTWLPKAIEISDRLDQWRFLPRIDPSQQAQFCVDSNALTTDFLNVYPRLWVGIDNMERGAHVGDTGATLIPARDVTDLRKVFDPALIDAFILNMASADYLQRANRAYKLPVLESGDVTADRSFYSAKEVYPFLHLLAAASGFTPADQFPGIIPGAMVSAHAPDATVADVGSQVLSSNVGSSPFAPITAAQLTAYAAETQQTVESATAQLAQQQEDWWGNFTSGGM